MCEDFIEMIKNVNDRRIIKTKKAIRNAFAELLLEKKLSDITVTDVANKADVNRKTFYNYYGCVDDLIKEIEDEFIKIFEADLKTIEVVDNFQNPAVLFHRLVTLFETDVQLYSVLLNTDVSQNFLHRIELLLKEIAKEFFLEKKPEHKDNIILACEYCISGICAVFKYWFNSGRAMTVEEVSEKVNRLCIGSIQHLIRDL